MSKIPKCKYCKHKLEHLIESRFGEMKFKVELENNGLVVRDEIEKENSMETIVYTCPYCGYEVADDYNAAVKLLGGKI